MLDVFLRSSVLLESTGTPEALNKSFKAFKRFLSRVPALNGFKPEFFALKTIIDKRLMTAKPNRKPAEVRDAAAYMARIRKNMEAVVMVVEQDNLFDPQDGSDTVILRSAPLKNRKVSDDPAYAICPDSMYADQLSAYAIGTGFFVGKRMVASAAHVLHQPGQDFGNLRFVRDVCMLDAGDFETEIRIPKSRVFKPVSGLKEPNAWYLSKMSSDWGLVKVEPAYGTVKEDRFNPVMLPDAKAYALLFDQGKLKSKPVYGIGHGLALPTKVSYTGKVSWVGKKRAYFETNLALLGGNSGSPIFDAVSHELIGIYIRGTKKLMMAQCGDGAQGLVVRIAPSHAEGQECQRLEPVLAALKKIK